MKRVKRESGPFPPGVDEVALHGDPVSHGHQRVRHDVPVYVRQLHTFIEKNKPVFLLNSSFGNCYKNYFKHNTHLS
jgi:hypothetical protein